MRKKNAPTFAKTRNRHVNRFFSFMVVLWIVWIFYARFQLNHSNGVFIDFGLTLVIIASALAFRRYAVGVQYTFYDHDTLNYKKIITDTLKEYGLTETIYEQSSNPKVSLIYFPGQSMEIGIETFRRFPFAEPSVVVSFKRWGKKDLMALIIHKLELELSNYDQNIKKNYVFVVVVGILSLLLIATAGNTEFLRKMDMSIVPEAGLPQQLVITRLDRNITDDKKHETFVVKNPDQIAQFYKAYADIDMNYTKGVDIQRSIMEYYYTVQLDQPWKTLYMGAYKADLRIDYAVMSKESGWLRPFVWLHLLFSDDTEAIYHVYTDFDTQNDILEIFDSLR